MGLDVHADMLYNASSSYAPSSVPVTTLSWFYTTVGIIGGLLALEQAVYRYKKRHLPGANWTIPLIGKFADSMSPSMEGYQKQWDSGPLSVISVFNIFIVMASSNQYARKILNSPMYAEPALVHSGKQVIGSDNWVFLTGKDHVEYRKVLNLLFTRKALGIYLGLQDSVARKHFTQWLNSAAADPSAKPIMMTARQANMETSLRVFCGYHIPETAVDEINDKYWLITQSLELVNFPLPLPGTKVYKAIQARKFVMHWLELAASKSKLAMADGGAPECMMDEWVSIMAEPGYKGRKDFSNYEMAQVVFSFLFASQDAMSSGVIYGFQHLADHPDILEKVRQEQDRVRMGNYQAPMTLEMLDEMVYLQAVVKESLRVKPPVTMVPYRCKKAFPINENYTVPAGSMVIPSFYNSLHDPEVYPQPDKFYPERWLDSKGSAKSNAQNYLVFGSGPHKCIGLEYAQMSIALMLANAAVLMDFEHEITPLSSKVEIIATLFPKDGCRLKLSPRGQA
uniref:C-22 sterol desaturase n=1 Tax=Agaricus subrufescens TaxID=87252 RepID=A0A7G4WM55_9AGAR|nr:C-22 sterol desaturase [Agaricus subrufescens]